MKFVAWLMVAVLAVGGAESHMTEGDLAWLHDADMTIAAIGNHIEGTIYYSSLYSQYDHVMSMREVAEASLNYSLNATVSNETILEAKPLYESYLMDIIAGTEYSEAIYSSESLAEIRANSTAAEVYYTNSSIKLMKLYEIFGLI